VPAEAGAAPDLEPLPQEFLDRLAGQDELLVSSRDRASRGTVRMWFAVMPPGFIFLLTPSYTRKAERWREDPWVRFRVPGTEFAQEATLRRLGWSEAQASAERLTASFAMAGAATPEALRWMLDDGSHLLFQAGRQRASASEPFLAVEPEHGR